MPYVDIPMGRVAYSDDGRGTPIVLLHANPGDRRDWDAIVPELARAHRVVAVDWPGYGESAAPAAPSRTTAAEYARALAEMVTKLDLPRAVYVGNSLGGYASVRLALDAPGRVRGLVLVNPGGFTPHTWLTRAFCATKGREVVTRALAGRLARRYLVRRTPVTAAMIARADAEQHTPSRVAVDAALWRSFTAPDHDLRHAARGVAAPVLLVWGRHDPLLPLARDGRSARESFPAARFVELATGHSAHAEDPPAFLAALAPFLAEVA